MPSERGLKIIDIIKSYKTEHPSGRSPTYEEIAIRLGLSPTSKAAVAEEIKKLKEEGLVKREFRTRGDIEVTA